MKNHGLWMVLCCILPMLAIFLLPGLGVKSDGAVFFFVLMMFICHFLMMRIGHDHADKEDKKGEHHGCH